MNLSMKGGTAVFSEVLRTLPLRSKPSLESCLPEVAYIVSSRKSVISELSLSRIRNELLILPTETYSLR